MIYKIALAAVAIVVVLCSQAWAATHPNQKKIANWTAKQAKLQTKIDAENARPASGFVSTVQFAPTAVAYRSPVVRVQAVVPQVQVQVQAAPPAVETEYLPEPPVVEETPVVVPQIVVPRTIRYYNNAPIYRTYSAPPVYRVYRSYRAAPVLDCPIFGAFGASADGSTWLQRYHARKADEHARKAAIHASKS